MSFFTDSFEGQLMLFVLDNVHSLLVFIYINDFLSIRSKVVAQRRKIAGFSVLELDNVGFSILSGSLPFGGVAQMSGLRIFLMRKRRAAAGLMDNLMGHVLCILNASLRSLGQEFIV